MAILMISLVISGFIILNGNGLISRTWMNSMLISLSEAPI